MTETPVEWVKRRMREKGLRQVDLANAIGANNPNKISKAFAGERQFKVHEMDILRAMLAEEPSAPLEGAKPTRRIPYVGSVPGGNWREAIQQPQGTIQVPEEDIPADAIALRVDGDSMDKLVPDGATVIFSPSDKALYADHYYVVINEEGETTFKQYRTDPARLVPCSNNPRHTDIIIGQGTFEIVGRVEWFAARLPRRMPS